MSYPLPLTIEFSAFPPNFSGTPDEMRVLLEDGVSITSESPVSLINISDVAPTSDEGPFALNGNQWQYWDDATGQYVDFLVPQASLRYVVSATEPDETVYDLWIELDGSNNPIAVKTYNGTDWVSAYYEKTEVYTQAEVDALVATAAVTASVFSVTKSIPQTVTGNGARVKVTWEDESADADGVLDTTLSRFTAPAAGIYQFWFDLRMFTSAGAGTGIARIFEMRVNGVTNAWEYLYPQDDENGANDRVFPVMMLLNAGDYTELWCEIDDTGNATYTIDNTNTRWIGALLRAT